MAALPILPQVHTPSFFFFYLFVWCLFFLGGRVILENLSCSKVRGCLSPRRVAVGPLAERMGEQGAKPAHQFQSSLLGAFLPQSLYQGCPLVRPPNCQLQCFSPPLPPTPQVCLYGSLAGLSSSPAQHLQFKCLFPRPAGAGLVVILGLWMAYLI